MADLNPKQVQSWVDAQPIQERTENAPRLLGVILKDATRLGLMETNVSTRARAPHRVKVKRGGFTTAEVQTILEAATRSRMQSLLRFATATGLRRGELCGLQWEDLIADVVRVRRQVVARGVIQEMPKSNAGRRDVPLTRDAKAAIASQKARGAREARNSEYVFPTRDGRPIPIMCRLRPRRSWPRRTCGTARFTSYATHTLVCC